MVAAVPSRCAICDHERAGELDAAARAASSLDERMHVAERFAVTRAAIAKHLKNCLAPAPAESPPDSGARLAPVAGKGEAAVHDPPTALPPPRELAAPDEELRRRATLLTRHLERPDLEPRQVAQVSNALASIDRLVLARERSAAPIDEHPDFEGVVEDLVSAVLDTLGPRAPEGIEAQIAAAFEERQATRAGAHRPALPRAA